MRMRLAAFLLSLALIVVAPAAVTAQTATPQSELQTIAAELVKLAERLLTVAAGLTPLPTPTPPPLPPPAGKAALTSADFTYVGTFYLPYEATAYAHGFTLRRVGTELRALTLAYTETGQQLIEFRVPSDLSGIPTAVVTRNFGNIFRKAGGTYAMPSMANAATTTVIFGLYWDPLTQRLYWTGGGTYEVTGAQYASVCYSTLDDTLKKGTAVGCWGFKDRSWKFTIGGVTALPQWWADLHTGGRRLAAGFGGGAASSGVTTASMGPALTAFDPNFGGAAASALTVAHTPLVGYPWGGTANDGVNSWYSLGLPAPTDEYPERAHRNADYTNELDPNWGPHGGKGRWTWTDGAMGQIGTWIDTSTRHGFFIARTQPDGRLWYGNGGSNAERASHQWDIYDPADLATVANGATRQWAIQPRASIAVQYPGFAYPLITNGYYWHATTGVTFDPVARRLYIMVRGANPEWQSAVYVYQIAG